MTITTQFGEFAIATQYGKYEDGSPAAHSAIANVAFISNPSDADTLTIGAIAYRFKTTPAAQNDVKLGSTLAATLVNLLSAIQGTAVASAYYTATQPVIDATAEVNGSTLFLTAYVPGKAGNSIPLAQSAGSDARYTLTAWAYGLNGGQVRTAKGRVAISALPLNSETLVIGSTTYTFTTSTNTGNNFSLALYTTPQLLAAAIASRIAANTAITNITVVGSQVAFDNVSSGAAGNSTILSETVVDATALVVTGSGTLTGGADLSTFNRSALTWLRLRARDIDYSDQQMQETIPLEVGGTMVPTGAYKSGVAVAGGAMVMPRLENSLGVLLLAALGKADTTNPSTGVYQHVFKFQTNEINIPWLAARRMIPGRDDVSGNGIIGFDNKVNVLRTTVSAAAPVEMMLQLMGRVPEMDNHPEAWTGSSFEDYTSIPLACTGSFSLPTITDFPNPLPTPQVVVEMANVTTTPREEMIVGSYFMDDVVPRTRALTFRFIYKWRDAALAQYLFGNGLKSTAWSPTPFVTNTSGGTPAVDLLVQSPYNIGATATKFSLEIKANSVFWQPAPIRLRAGDIVTMDIVGTALYNTSGYVTFTLTNGTSSYTVPSEP